MKIKQIGTLFILTLFIVSFVFTATCLAGSPKKGGELRFAYGQFPSHFNAAIQSGAAIQVSAAQLFVALLENDDQFQPVPYLAKSWEVSDGGLTYTFHLVENTTFHDGKPVTSADVAFSLDVVKNNHPFGKPMFGMVETVETPDPYTAVFKLSRPQPALLQSVVPVLLPIIPKHIYGDGQPIRKHPANINPIGSGPFKLAEFKPGESFVLDRFDNFLRPGRPYLDRVIGVHVKDPSSAEVAFKNQDLHYSGFNAVFRLKSLPRLEKMKHISLSQDGYEGIGPLSYLEFNLRKAPFDNVKVRRALAYAIDQDFITQKLQHGLTTPATGPIHHSSPFYTDDVNKYDFNIDKANQLLDEAGYPRKDNGIRFSATLDWLPYVFDDHQMVAEYLKPQFKKIGVDVKLRRPSDFGTWIKQVASWDYEMSLNLIFCYPDPVIGVHRLFLTDNIKHIPWSNTQGYSNPTVDDLLAKAAVEMDFAKRKALYAEFQKIITDDVPMVFIHSPAYHTIYNANLDGINWSVWGAMSPADGIYWKDGKTPK